MKAKKSLGQNFLKNKEVLGRAAESLGINGADTVVEVGPGHGELTGFLAARNPKELVVIEKDEKLVPALTGLFPEARVVSGDALEELKNLRIEEDWKLAGNIPFYITGRLLRTISELQNPPLKTVLLLQKEVAERICSAPPKANLLSSVTRGWASPEYLFTVSRSDFYPVPRVDSAVISLTRNKLIAPEAYFSTARALFRQPRKKAINNLADSFDIPKSDALKLFVSCGMSPEERPQDISPERILCLSRLL
jgi:16S rRNA (adenine1518-N6/adenine1519-N6)-dimethyltransferase